MEKYNSIDQTEYLLEYNLLGAQNYDDLEQLERMCIPIIRFFRSNFWGSLQKGCFLFMINHY